MTGDRARCAVGIDGGGSGSRAALVRGGQVLAEAVGGPVQAATMTEEAITANLDALLDRLGLNPPAPEVGAICLGAAGATGPRRAVLVRWCQARLPNASVDVARDIDLVLHGVELPAVALLAGTGAMAVGIDAGGRRITVDGLGFLLGDVGGGYWIGREALSRSMSVRDREGDPDPLLDALLDGLGLEAPADLPRLVTGGLVAVTAIASLAPIVCRLAAEDVTPAVEIVTDAATALATTFRHAVARLGTPPSSVRVSGSMTLDPMIRTALAAAIEETAPTASVVWTADGLTGALARSLESLSPA